MKGSGVNVAEMLKMFWDSGWVVWPIMALSVLMVAITLERLLVVWLEKLRMKPAKFLDLFLSSLKKNNGDKLRTVDEMLAHCSKRKGIGNEIVQASLIKYKDGAAKKMTPIELKQWMKQSYEERAGIELPALDAHLVWLAVISNVATLCGLFGTVIGMIDSFSAMSRSAGGVKADEMAGGIATALVATAGGLVVAVPSMLLYNWIKNTVEAFVGQLEEVTIKVVDTLAE